MADDAPGQGRGDRSLRPSRPTPPVAPGTANPANPANPASPAIPVRPATGAVTRAAAVPSPAKGKGASSVATPPPVPSAPAPSRGRAERAARADDRLYGTARNLLLAFVAAIAAFLFMVHRLLEPREAVFALAACVVVLLLAALAFYWTYGPRLPVWVTIGAAFAASRGVLALSTGQLFAARDALDHVYGLPLAIARLGHIPNTDTNSSYPALHLLLAQVHLLTGVSLWASAAMLGLLMGLGTLALVGRTGEAGWPGTGPLACIGLLVAWLAVPPGELYQPMSLATLMLAGAVFLVLKGVPWAPGLFFFLLLVLGLSHPYSAAILGIVLFLALTPFTALGLGRRFIIPMAVALGLGLVYVAYGSADLTYFLDILVPHSGSDTIVSTGGSADPAGPVNSGHPTYSSLYRTLDTWGFRIAMLAAVAGWVWAFWPRKPFLKQVLFLQFAAVSAAVTFLIANTQPLGLSPRVLTLSSVVLAPLVGLLFRRSPRLLVAPLVAVMAVLAVTAPTAAYQVYPWSTNDATLHAFDDPAATGDLVPLFLSIEDGSYRRSNPVSSHPVFDQDVALQVRGFSASDAPGKAPDGHYIYREDSQEFGYSVGISQAGSAGRTAGYRPYPTESQLELLDTLDRFADIGPFHLSRL